MKITIPLKLSLCILILLDFTILTFAQAGRGKARIGGVVVDENGNPINSAKIVIYFEGKEQIKRETTSDSKGKWSIIGLGTGDWRITASAEGYFPAFDDVYVKQLQQTPRITMTLKRIPPSEEKILQDESSLALLEKANQFYKEGKYQAAIDLCREFLEENPQAYQTHLSIGDCYKEQGELDKAMDEYNIVLEEAKKDELTGKKMTAKALASLGDCHLKKGNIEKAQSLFQQSIEVSADDAILAFNVGEIYFSNQKIDEALYYFELSAQIKPDWSDPYLKLGYVYLNKGDNERAIEYFNKFLELEPDSERSSNVKKIIETLKKQ